MKNSNFLPNPLHFIAFQSPEATSWEHFLHFLLALTFLSILYLEHTIPKPCSFKQQMFICSWPCDSGWAWWGWLVSASRGVGQAGQPRSMAGTSAGWLEGPRAGRALPFPLESLIPQGSSLLRWPLVQQGTWTFPMAASCRGVENRSWKAEVLEKT